jgi:elongation factor P
MINATEIRKGMIIRHAEKNWLVIKSDHVTRGNWRSYMQVKLRNLDSGTLSDERFRSDERIDRIFIDQKDMEYLYADAHQLTFMNPEDYEQLQLPRDLLGEDVQWLKENDKVKVSFIDGRAVSVELPPTVTLKVSDTEPGLKGATVTNVFKPAKLETGATVQVPPFIEPGEMIIVDTRDGQYVGRANA